ncbi:cilia- and flagella-associated protein 91-like [Tachysurus ichikawai]
MKVHQATVDLYLEDVILHSIDQTAEAQAREEIHKFAEELNNITYAMEEIAPLCFISTIVLKVMVKKFSATVDLYLEDVILHSIDQTAEAQAREEIHKFAEELNNITYAMEEMRNNEQSEEIVAQLVYSFLIPEVQKVTARERVKLSQRRHLHAAHFLIHDTDSSSTSPRPLSPASRASTSLLSQIVEQVEEASHNSNLENEHTD